ncbi:restriction endonuclease subunit S [Pseudomonas sp. PDM30]|uniref:restriction endonuclease subunit S n=1 Tax=Pseudomonas sp. PDM30 TaxID=2854773 RepID=UPI001C46D09B|nr:restriction endonuclease subunit S [Pseudomonas sp. PDM30]MBV7488038.1 restriction endonuclease subunit S [Pseudomonas sp. PDM30]
MSAEVKLGFKQTEAGVLPVDWEAKKLGEVASFRTGPFGSALHKSDYTNDGIPVVNPMHILDGRIVPTASMTITEEAAKSLDEFRLSLGEVIIGRRGDMGRCAVVSERERGWLCGTGSMIVRPSVSVNAYFLQRVLSTPSIIKAIEDSSVGSTMINLNQGTLSNLVVQAPSVEEQRAIAATLSDMDALISNLDQLVTKKRDIHQAAMQQLLTGQRRLPGFSGAWDVKPMRALGNTYGGLAGKTKIDFGHGEARYIPFMNVMTDTVIDASWLEPVDVAPDEAQNLAKKGDLFFNGSSETPEEVGFCSVLLDEIQNLYLNSFCFGFRFNTAAKVNGLFFAYWFRSKAGRAAMSVLAQGATRYNIAKSAFMLLEIPQPLEEEQTAIATVLSDMGAELAALEVRREKALQLKQGMMQELLTGRIRLT